MASADDASAGDGALVTDPAALRAAQSKVNDLADALATKLRETGADVEETLETWHGGAAVKWSSGWAEVHDGALELSNILGALSDALGDAAGGYEQQETENQSGLVGVQQASRINL